MMSLYPIRRIIILQEYLRIIAYLATDYSFIVPTKLLYDYTVCCGTYLTDTLTRQSEYIPLSDQYRETLKYGVLFRVLADLQDFETDSKLSRFICQIF
jgi:hypothetical protein